MTVYFTLGMAFVAFILYGACPERDERIRRVGRRRIVPFMAIGVVLWPILLASLVAYYVGGGDED
jgi:nitrate reductase NapE component